VAFSSYSEDYCADLGDLSTIELLHSTDGGHSWTQTTIEEICENFEFISSPQVAVDSRGRVYVAFSDFGDFGSTQQFRMAVSSDHGSTFGPAKNVAQVHYIGQSGLFSGLQGGVDFETKPAIALDPRNDRVWIAWHDGRNNIRGFASGSDTYAFSDILFITSSDGGQTWTPPQAVSPRHPFLGVGRDQFSPSIAVDQSGTVAVCYYDRRNDRNNFSADRYCSITTNNGMSWQDEKKTANPFLMEPYVDDLTFDGAAVVGLFDGTATDYLRTHAGFISAFTIVNSGNPDVYAARF
jgi:hypothetical protein